MKGFRIFGLCFLSAIFGAAVTSVAHKQHERIQNTGPTTNAFTFFQGESGQGLMQLLADHNVGFENSQVSLTEEGAHFFISLENQQAKKLVASIQENYPDTFLNFTIESDFGTYYLLGGNLVDLSEMMKPFAEKQPK